jgi:hypothetical protein
LSFLAISLEEDRSRIVIAFLDRTQVPRSIWSWYSHLVLPGSPFVQGRETGGDTDMQHTLFETIAEVAVIAIDICLAFVDIGFAPHLSFAAYLLR